MDPSLVPSPGGHTDGADNGPSDTGKGDPAGSDAAVKSTLDQLEALMVQAAELASWAAASPYGAEDPQGVDPAAGTTGEAALEAGTVEAAEREEPSDNTPEPEAAQQGPKAHAAAEDPSDRVGSTLAAMIADSRIAAAVVVGEGSSEVAGTLTSISQSSLAALGSLAPRGAILEVTTVSGEYRAIRAGAWALALEVGSGAAAEVDALLDELLAASGDGASEANP